jgi:CelD/BcsL family acetyltransferase involved in cellulose biosynthesis
MGLRQGQVVLVPALHQGPEVAALRAAGLECRFYGSGDDSSPVVEDLERLVDTRVRALYLVHHLGFPQAADRWLAWCRERSLLLIEDCSHAWLAEHGARAVGSSGALAIFSFQATLPLPVGDALLVRSFREPAVRGAAPLADLGARLLLARLADVDIAVRRRTNYRLLLSELRDVVPPAFSTLHDGASPWVFPVNVDRPRALLERLDRAGVGAVPLWDSMAVSPSVRPSLLGGRPVIGVPVHQELREDELERVADAVRPPHRRPFRLELVTDFDQLAGAWDDLAAASGNLFATREWLTTWFRHYGTGEPLLVTCTTGAGRLAAILPLEVVSMRGARVLRFLGHGPSDQMGPICHEEDVGIAARAMRRVLTRPPRRFQLFVGRHLPGPADWGRLLGARRVREVSNPILYFGDATWDEVLSTFGSRLRTEIRYDARRLEREHEVRYRRCDDAHALDAGLDVLFALHAAQWDSVSYFSDHEPFHRDFAAIAERRGWLRLWVLEVDGRPVAAKYNFRYCGAEFSYQAGRDPAWRGPSLGLVNVSNAMRASLEEGAREYRFLRGSERYKFRFPVVDRPLQTVARGSGAVGRTVLAAGTALDDAQPLRATRRAIARRVDSAVRPA